MAHSKIFQHNITKWAEKSPQEAKFIETFECQNVNFCTTGPQKQTNLIINNAGIFEYFHSEIDVYTEAKEWFFELDLVNKHLLYVYGVGLGYYFQAAKFWLQNTDNFLVFFETNPEVIHRLFETDLGAELLNHRQVYLVFIPNMNKCAQIIESTAENFILKKFKTSALKLYEETKVSEFNIINSTISYISDYEIGRSIEYLSFGKGFYNNYYNNELELPKSYSGDSMWGKFQNVPAIICGAGPSIDRNLDILETLKDRALIFAGGSAMNAININGFTPHFGVGIDPNWAQFTRLLANVAYTVPFFYRNRMFYEAFRLIHGDRIYVTGTAGHNISEWFEEKLEIENKKTLIEGFNVINFSIAIAHALGCNPIITVGVDLAYTDSKSYATGVKNHPIHDPKDDFTTKTEKEELLVKNDIYGRNTTTLWKWVRESMWYYPYMNYNPGLIIINSTEGGIGFPNIPNIPLKVIADKLVKQYDFDSLIHCEMQNSKFPPSVNFENVIKYMNVLKDSLQKCQECCQTLVEEFFAVINQLKINPSTEVNLISEKTMDALTELDDQAGYTYILNTFNESYLKIFGTRFQQINDDPEIEKEINIKKAELNTQRYEFLKNTAFVNIKILEGTLTEYENKLDERKPDLTRIENQKNNPDDVYSIENGVFKIIDPEMNIAFEEAFNPTEYAKETFDSQNGQLLVNYPNGSMHIEQYYQNGLVHGPSIYFGENGNVTCHSWFIKGLKQGKAWFYYQSGALYCLKKFLDGKLHGKQIFYFENGLVRSILNYSHGQYHGEILLYHGNGSLNREFHFVNGKQNGVEKFWDESGQLTIETFFKDGKPVGKTRSWYSDGKLAKDVDYDENSNISKILRYDLDGTLWNNEVHGKNDYFDKVTQQTHKLTLAIEQIIAQVTNLENVLNIHYNTNDKTTEVQQLKEMISAIHAKMNALKEINTKLHFASGLSPDNKNEQIWKTPTVRREIELTLEKISKQMSEEILSINTQLKTTVEQLIKNQSSPNNNKKNQVQ